MRTLGEIFAGETGAPLNLDGVPPLSEEMLRRDNYFHSCWTRLKHKRPDLALEMNEIECFVAGYVPEPEPMTEEQKNEKKKKEGIIL